MVRLPDWAHALGVPLFAGRIRESCRDFSVVEELDIEFSGDGEHDWLRIRKTDANTHWAAEQLARRASVSVRDVGYAGLKDRRAIATQWFSVPRKPGAETDWTGLAVQGIEVLEIRRHNRKLRRGAHRGNAFRIAIRGEEPLPTDDVTERLQQIAEQGVPNYFGEQRFGRDAANIELGRAVLDGRRVSRHRRSLGLSALRSYEFNSELDARVRDGTWNKLLPGDTANLDGTGSVFSVEEVTQELERRCSELDIHPCGSLPPLEALRVAAGTRALRMRVAGLQWQFDEDVLWLDFRLGKGNFATAVIREIASL